MPRLLPPACLLTILTASSLAADPARLVADLDRETDAAFSGAPEPLLAVDDVLYFWNTDPVTGTELWKSDGTAAGTTLVDDVCPGRCGSRPPRPEAAAAAGLLFFNACDGAHGCQLWRSDGTARGTRLVKPLARADRPLLLRHLTPWNDALHFAVGVAIYRTDGTAGGTELVAELHPGGGAAPLTRLVVAGNRLFASTVNELWVSDGTAAGTEKILELPEGRRLDSLQSVVGDRLFFTTAGTSLPNVLWTSDGTAAGTMKLRDARGWISGLVPVGGEVLFFDNTNEGVTLWTTDGTLAGTERVRGGLSNHADPLVVFDGELYFANLSTLWRSDGTAAGTRVAHRFGASVVDLGVAGGSVYALTWSIGETNVWRTRGTAATTERVLGGTAGRFEELFVVGDRLALPVTRDGEGEELALLDPETEELTFVTDGIDPGSGNPTSLVDDGDRLLFMAESGMAESGIAEGGVHATRGTAASTELLAEFPPTARLVRAGGDTFVFDEGLWLLDPAGATVPLAAGSERTRFDADLAVALNGELFFLVLDRGLDRYELWRSDGTAAGTGVAATGIPPNVFCFDFCAPVHVDIVAAADEIFVVHEAVLLRADLPARTMETVFDGEARHAGPDAEGCCRVQDLAPVGDRLFFTTFGRDEPLTLWTTDGTAAARVRDLLPPPIFVPLPIRELLGVGDRLYFVLRDPEHGEELWSSDGTAAGTAVVRDIWPGAPSSFPRHLTAFDGRLVFAADDGVAGHELWTSDGTAAGTVRVADVCAGRCSSTPREITRFGGVVVFAADDGVTGAEPWRSDLTAEGTWRIDDVNPGRAPSGPRDFTAADRRIYFNAATAADGFELHQVPRAALRDPTEPCDGCLVDGRFHVRVDWVDPRGVRGAGRPIVHDDHNVFFWFFSPDNVELLVKVLDGTAINGHYWVFHGALSDVEYTITVEDRHAGTVRTYHNPAGNLCGQGDVEAFPIDDETVASGTISPRKASPMAKSVTKQGTCGPDDRTLCLNDGRFRVEVDWVDPRGARGAGHALPLTDATGAFWFFGQENLELVVKVLDGRAINGRFWFFYGGLSDVEYTITVTDTESGERRVYRNAAGELCGQGDVGAF